MVRAGEDQGGEGEIVLATTHPETPKVRLRVTFTVRAVAARSHAVAAGRRRATPLRLRVRG